MASLAVKKKKPVEHSIKRKNKEEEERRGGGATLDEFKALGHQLLCSRAHINNLPVLLSYLSPSSPLELALESLISLQSFFTPLVLEIPPSSSSSLTSGLKTVQETETEKDPESVYKAWLRAKFDEFVNLLIDAAVSPQSSEALRDVALDAIMEFVKQGRDGKFQSAVYHRFLHRVVYATSSAKPLLDLIAPKYFNYLDVRYFTYTSMDKIGKTFNLMELDGDGRVNLDNDPELHKSRMEVAVHNIHDILSCISPLELLDKEPSHEMWSQSEAGKVSFKVLVGHGKPKQAANTNDEVISAGRIAKKLKLKFTKAWLSFLKLPLPLDVYKEVLPALHQNVIPFMANPAVLCDFLTKSYDIGGVISVMALSGLFILMTQHGLEYPNFYEKLYALLRPAVFMAKHRAVFFQLLDTCLRSAYLPAYLAAAFTKKLSRLSLSVPPSGELVIIAIIHNLLRRHPSINFLVHQQLHDETDRDGPPGADKPREDESESATGPIVHSKKCGIDPFNNEESDPVKSNAMRSSLWEIDTLRHHYCPLVSRFVSSLENDLTVRAKTSEVTVADFSSGSYASIFKSEMRRRVKQVPLAFYKVAPTTLFWESDFPGWTFGGLHNGKQQTGVQKNDVTNEGENGDYGPAKRQRLEGS